jgi:hypothetical protein
VIFRYLISTADGDLEARWEHLNLPYMTGLGKHHAFLKLGDWFEAARGSLLKALERGDAPGLFKGIEACNVSSEAAVRSEKHGALYHVASLDIRLGKETKRLCLLTSLSSTGGRWLTREFETLLMLAKDPALPYLPKTLWQDSHEIERGGVRETFLFAFLEWLEGYHEWHISHKEPSGIDVIRIWEGKGRIASQSEAYEIYHSASRILTNYFDPATLRQIRPWHHAAGDFVVGSFKGRLEVRLCSARDYSPSPLFQNAKPADPWTGLVFFLLETSVRMRLDKLEGKGPNVWAGPWSLPPVVRGILEGLLERGKRQGGSGVNPSALLSLLRGFSRDEYVRLLESIKDILEDPSDAALFSENLASHAQELMEAINTFPPGDPQGGC